MSEEKTIERCGAKAVIRDSLVGALISTSLVIYFKLADCIGRIWWLLSEMKWEKQFC